MNDYINIIMLFSIAFVVSFFMTPFVKNLAIKVNAIDVPKDERRVHKKPIPRLGGLAMLSGFIMALIYYFIMVGMDSVVFNSKILGLILGIIIIEIAGIWDDIKPIRAWTKLAFQIAAAAVVVGFGVRVEFLTNPFVENGIFELGIWSVPLTMLWIVGITNAINLIDGLDGLSTGIAIISSVSLLIIFALNGSPFIAIIIITALVGALSGFLPFNFNPAKTFIGDIGSNFVGFILAIVSILGVAKTATAFVVVLPMIVLGLPIFDTLSAIVRRLIKGKSLKAVFQADKGHLHHKLIEKGFSQKEAVLTLYGISVACGMFAVILFESDIWKAISFALMVIAVVCIGYKEFFKLKEEENK